MPPRGSVPFPPPRLVGPPARRRGRAPNERETTHTPPQPPAGCGCMGSDGGGALAGPSKNTYNKDKGSAGYASPRGMNASRRARIRRAATRLLRPYLAKASESIWMSISIERPLDPLPSYLPSLLSSTSILFRWRRSGAMDLFAFNLTYRVWVCRGC